MKKVSLRERNRLAAMHLVQGTAVAMFEDHGFDDVTIEAVADQCGVSASTIFRHFGTKENTVLWDDRDSMIEVQILERLRHQTPVQAFRDAVVFGLAERDDRDLFLRRLKLIYREPAIWAAAAQQDRIDRGELARAFAAAGGRGQLELTNEYVAAACLTALDVALDYWQREDGSTALADLVDQAVVAATHLR
ncbi:MAG: TetR/AcrR family transcriptional regulator [Actinomycetia bacterium]|nr:TetR/AcrR family transcriptional regulator [Actinomycetes bacterium]